MRTTIFSVFAALLISTQAFAIFIPGQERPVFQAELLVSEATGALAHEEFVRIAKYTVAGQNVTGFYLNLENQETKKLIVTSVNAIGCGSFEIHAEDIAPQAVQGNYLRLTIVDHSSRLCHDLPANLLEVEIEKFEAPYFEPVGYLKASGTAQPVFTIQ